MACFDGWDYGEDAVNGECPGCGMPTVDGRAQYGCEYSPIDCKTCGSQSCDESC